MRIFSSEQVSSDRTMQTASLLFFPLSRTVSPLNSCSSSIFACKQQNVRTSFWKNRNSSIWRRVIWLWKLHLGSDILNPEDRDFHYSGVELNLTLEEGYKLKWILQTETQKNILSRRSVRKQDKPPSVVTAVASDANTCIHVAKSHFKLIDSNSLQITRLNALPLQMTHLGQWHNTVVFIDGFINN